MPSRVQRKQEARLRRDLNSHEKEGEHFIGSSNKPIASLTNLGPKSQAMLHSAGITSLKQLKELGSVAAYARVKATGSNASLNLLWALEGAVTGVPWQLVAKHHRTSLLLALDEYARHKL